MGGHVKGYYGIMIGNCHSNGTISHSPSDSRSLSTNELDLLFRPLLIQSSFSITSSGLLVCDQFLRREVYFLLLNSNSVILNLVSFLTSSLKMSFSIVKFSLQQFFCFLVDSLLSTILFFDFLKFSIDSGYFPSFK